VGEVSPTIGSKIPTGSDPDGEIRGEGGDVYTCRTTDHASGAPKLDDMGFRSKKTIVTRQIETKKKLRNQE